jgi:hypothetical protein
MAHWSEKYIGIPYESDEAFCSILARRIRTEEFNHQPLMPSFKRWKILREDPQVLAADYGIPTKEPKDGDAVIMQYGKRWHIGIYCFIAGEGYVLHATSTVGTSHLTKVRDLPRQGMRLEGFYKWK